MIAVYGTRPPLPLRCVAVVVGALLLVSSGDCAWAQPADSSQTPTVHVQSAEFQAAKTSHLWRVGAWGGANALGGLALVWASSRSTQSTRWHFGAMSAGWGLVNAGIA
ncbi:MAG: hypothetical protein V5A20_07435, partial [Salinibacter sp.]